jgi:hypothetical protein
LFSSVSSLCPALPVSHRARCKRSARHWRPPSPHGGGFRARAIVRAAGMPRS